MRGGSRRRDARGAGDVHTTRSFALRDETREPNPSRGMRATASCETRAIRYRAATADRYRAAPAALSAKTTSERVLANRSNTAPRSLSTCQTRRRRVCFRFHSFSRGAFDASPRSGPRRRRRRIRRRFAFPFSDVILAQPRALGAESKRERELGGHFHLRRGREDGENVRGVERR